MPAWDLIDLGNRLQRHCVKLAPPQKETPSDLTAAAEFSRPRAIVLEGLRPLDPNHTGGRHRVIVRNRSQRTNWFTPIYWTMICEVANSQTHAYEKSGSKIVKELKQCSILFRGLSTQVLNKYFTGDLGKRCFTNWALERAASTSEHKAIASTRRGVLVRASISLYPMVSVLNA